MTLKHFRNVDLATFILLFSLLNAAAFQSPVYKLALSTRTGLDRDTVLAVVTPFFLQPVVTVAILGPVGRRRAAFRAASVGRRAAAGAGRRGLAGRAVGRLWRLPDHVSNDRVEPGAALQATAIFMPLACDGRMAEPV